MKLLIATNNKNKINEIRQKILEFNLDVDLYTLSDFSDEEIEIKETGETLEENAMIKAKTCFDLLKIPSFADDTGLEVFSLDGKPGVHSARFSGVYGDDKANRLKLLTLLQNKKEDERRARFRTIICFYDGSAPRFFEGICYGKIIEEERGNKGFGYDSIFVPDGFDKTFAEMNLNEKNEISHRSKAIVNFLNFLKDYLKQRYEN